MALKGIDISNNNGGIELKTVLEKNPMDFVIMKATQGNYFVDSYCDTFYQIAKKAGKLLGVYHYADGSGSAREEADFFVDNVQGYIGEAILILDWEKYSNIVFYTAGWVEAFVDRVYKRTGVYPVIYMNENTLHRKDARLSDFNWDDLLAMKCGLWLAQYADNNPTGFKADPWCTVNDYDVLIHQYSSHGELVGFGRELDLNIGYLTADAWKRVAVGNRKSGATLVNKEPTAVKPLTVGTNVKVTTVNDYNGIPNDNWVLSDVFEIMELSGDRVVLGNGIDITGAWRLQDVKAV